MPFVTSLRYSSSVVGKTRARGRVSASVLHSPEVHAMDSLRNAQLDEDGIDLHTGTVQLSLIVGAGIQRVCDNYLLGHFQVHISSSTMLRLGIR